MQVFSFNYLFNTFCNYCKRYLKFVGTSFPYFTYGSAQYRGFFNKNFNFLNKNKIFSHVRLFAKVTFFISAIIFAYFFADKEVVEFMERSIKSIILWRLPPFKIWILIFCQFNFFAKNFLCTNNILKKKILHFVVLLKNFSHT